MTGLSRSRYIHDYITEKRFSIIVSYAQESPADHPARSHGVCSSIAACFTALWLECCSPTSPQLRFRLKHRRKPQKGDSKDDALFTGQSGNHRPSQFQLFSPSFHHAGPLRSLLSAYTKHRAELLTGGGKAVLARLLVCRGWPLTGRIWRLIFSNVSRFTSSPATVVLNNNLLSLWGDNCALDTQAGFLILSNELGQSPVLKSRTL